MKNKLGDYYWYQSNTINNLTTKYYESCFDAYGSPISPDEPSIERASASDNLFSFIKDIYEESLGCNVEITIIPIDENEE